ncbi:hypothetical protein K1T71_002593 [Dendrolimus kikuchii]|uniref:Uncharacterized protein n=1 Tax=Dendrolimus kikuchii TaxID=765133 RepID=A0ACC1DDF2_9NEOP|nr:hypothetical protein K1T71_002593 [Dendrolimus kikuchii]
MKENSLNYLGSDPGAVKFGNFINYYSFHNVEKRMENLHPDMFPPSAGYELLCLDIGCNTGNLTQQLYLYLKNMYPEKNIYILAIDLDPKLIKRAQDTNNEKNITFISADIMAEEDKELVIKYLASFNQQRFHITFIFSVTMWIHLNNGDDGLLKFLHYLKDMSKILIIEPQPWSCYRNAQRRIKKSGSTFDFYKSLTIRSNVDTVIENILIDNYCKKIYESCQSSWKRKIQSYKCTD